MVWARRATKKNVRTEGQFGLQKDSRFITVTDIFRGTTRKLNEI